MKFGWKLLNSCNNKYVVRGGKIGELKGKKGARHEEGDFIPDDPEYVDIVKCPQDGDERSLSDALQGHRPTRKVQAGERPCASDWSEIISKRMNSSRTQQDHDNRTIDSQSMRTTKSEAQSHQDHIATRGQVSMSHNNMEHKPIPRPAAITILEAKAVLDKERTKLQKLPASDQ